MKILTIHNAPCGTRANWHTASASVCVRPCHEQMLNDSRLQGKPVAYELGFIGMT